MRNSLLVVAGIIFLTTAALAQTENTAPVVWERYRLGTNKMSLLLPKMPNVIAGSNACEDTESTQYSAFAEGVVYQISTTSSNQGKGGSWCKTFVRFGPANLEKRMNGLRELTKHEGEAITIVGQSAVRFRNDVSTYIVIADRSHNWIEMSMHYYPDSKPDLGRFFDSLQFSATNAKKIENGAPWTLGDPSDINDKGVRTGSVSAAQREPAPSDYADPSVRKDAHRILSKPRPRYTEDARRSEVSGSILLKVNLLSNGAVGSVTPVKALSHGLTDQAIAAARRIVFLPKRVNGVPVSVTVSVEYSFSIY